VGYSGASCKELTATGSRRGFVPAMHCWLLLLRRHEPAIVPRQLDLPRRSLRHPVLRCLLMVTLYAPWPMLADGTTCLRHAPCARTHAHTLTHTCAMV
jgi:hypothetical protein